MRKMLLGIAVAALLFSQEQPGQEKPAPKPGLPLVPDHKLEFDTDEGTWLSLDVSKDGKSILFEMLGDLYTVAIGGGQARPIMTGLAYDSQPVYSPDGSMIAFLSDRTGSENLWVAKADGTNPRQLSKDKRSEFVSPTWTPDGKYVVVSRAQEGLGANELWMYDIHGGSGVQVTKAKPKPDTPRNQELNALGAVASPDGKYFYYARRNGGFTYNATFPLWQIVRRDRVTGDEDVITENPGSAMRPLLSPDGKSLVFATRFETETGLRIRDLASGEERWLKYPVQRDDQESRATRDLMPGYAFTPDGKEVVACFGGKINRIQVATGESQAVPIRVHVALDLGPKLYVASRVEEGPVKARLMQEPSLSPDGKRVAFSALTHIYVTDLPNGKPTRISANGTREYEPSWSPDGEFLTYVTWAPNTGGQIWKWRANGQFQPQLVSRTPGYYQNPTFSPDGSKIVALRSSRQERVEALGGFGEQSGLDVVWFPKEGGEPNLIVPARGAGKPHFTAANDRIYVYSRQGLQSFRYDGTDRRTHVKVVTRNAGPGGGEPPSADDVQMAPNGTQALALASGQLYLIDVPAAGGEAPTINLATPSVPVKKLTDIGADSFEWAEGGKTIAWSVGASLFRIPAADVSFEGAAPKPTETSVDIEAPRAKPQGVIALEGAKIITMNGDEVIPDGEIIITDNRITSIGKRGPKPPENAKVIDVKGTTIMPGIVDVHAHWIEIRRKVLDLDSWPFLANLAFGVTTGRDPQTSRPDTFAYQDLIDMGELPGPRAFSTGPGIFNATDFQSLDEARNVVSRYKKYYRTNTVKSYMVGNRQQRQWMVMASKESGIMPTTEGGLDLKLDLTHAIDGFSGNEHALPIVPLYRDVVETYAKTGIFYTPTLLVAYGGPWAENYFYETTEVHNDAKLRRFIPHNYLDARAVRRPWFRKEEQVFPLLAASAAKIVHDGGNVQIGGHGQLQGIQCHWEMWALQSGGLSNFEVLRAATISGARAIGYAQDLGSLEPGKLADLIVLNRDPLQDIHNTTSIRYVMKNGELYDGDTLNQIWPKQKPLPELWWWKEKP